MSYRPQPVPSTDDLRELINQTLSVPTPVKSEIESCFNLLLDRIDDLEERYAHHEHKYRTSRGTFETSAPDPMWERSD